VRLFAAILVLAGTAGESANLPSAICLEDRAGISYRVRAAFDRELSALLGKGREMAQKRACPSAAGIRISIRTHAPSRYADALGVTWTAHDRVLPLIELYTSNVLKTLGGHAGSERFGRALARVAFHELQHYTRQERGHDEDGLFSRTVSASDLLTRAGR
jgi:hypothetical protein